MSVICWLHVANISKISVNRGQINYRNNLQNDVLVNTENFQGTKQVEQLKIIAKPTKHKYEIAKVDGVLIMHQTLTS